MRISSLRRGLKCWRKPRGCGSASASFPIGEEENSAFTGSPGPMSTLPWWTTISTPTSSPKTTSVTRQPPWTLQTLRQKREDLFASLANKIDLKDEEIDHWRRAADLMYLPYDQELEIHPQDDTFLYKKVWDFGHTPDDWYPLLLHYHPLVIYRQQVIKQADVALAMVLLGDRFSIEQKRRNFDYYDPLTTDDSSLSVCIQSILAQEVGYHDKALEYAHYAVLMDLGNVEGNVKDGCHIASLGGSWMLCVYGLAGMREYAGRLSFNPRLPKGLKSLCFPLTVRGRMLEIEISGEAATYRLRKGEQLTFRHWDHEIILFEGESKSAHIDSQTHSL